MNHVIIEGQISVGKSTLTKKLSEAINAKPYYEPVESNPYLDLYYKDPQKYALAMQFYLMSARFEMHEDGIQHLYKTRQSVLFDRSIWGDIIFAKRNFLDGNMSKLDYHNYIRMRDIMLKRLMVPHVMIYLKSEPEKCMERILSRGRSCEKAIPLSYLKGLHDLYNELAFEMAERGTKVVEIEWNEFKPLSYVIDQISPYLVKAI